MATRTVRYTTAVERDAFVADAEANGETMVRDDHHVNGRGNHEMDFEVLPEYIAPPDTPRQILERRITDNPNTIGLPDLVALVRLQIIGDD